MSHVGVPLPLLALVLSRPFVSPGAKPLCSKLVVYYYTIHNKCIDVLPVVYI